MQEVVGSMDVGCSNIWNKGGITMDDFNKELKEAIDRLDIVVDKFSTLIDKLSSICSLCIVSVNIVLIILAAVLIFG